jgi:acyl-CoA thioesterase YciA
MSNSIHDLEAIKNGELIYRGTKVCMERNIGVHKNMFGGELLSIIDESAAALACEICDTPHMVTRMMEQVEFCTPIKVGHMIKIYGGIVRIGNTSITLSIELRRYNVYTEQELIACSTKVVFVRINEDGNKIPISDRIKEKFKPVKS